MIMMEFMSVRLGMDRLHFAIEGGDRIAGGIVMSRKAGE
jgi:hypothetical protein